MHQMIWLKNIAITQKDLDKVTAVFNGSLMGEPAFDLSICLIIFITSEGRTNNLGVLKILALKDLKLKM